MDVAQYQVPSSLTILAGIFLAIGAISLLVIFIDIILRRGWRSMMWIMIPVWPITASFLGPFIVWLYWKYGRPTKAAEPGHHMAHDEEQGVSGNAEHHASDGNGQNHHGQHDHQGQHDHHDEQVHHDRQDQHDHQDQQDHHDQHDHHAHRTTEGGSTSSEKHVPMDHAHMHGHSKDRPMWVTVFIGVSHCGAGCVLGDIVGEWLVYGTNAKINGANLWVALLVDYAFALLFGIVFQYFSIAPMSGEWGARTVIRAIKADFLSLTFFEIGLFGWMVAYQIGIWNYQLMTNTWTYWWMMQVGMILGFITAVPINWWLISKAIKEPCA